MRCAATPADGPTRSYGRQSQAGKVRTSTFWAKKRKAPSNAERRAASRATNTDRPLRARTTSAMTRASKPSGAPTRSRRPGSSATRRIWAALTGREASSAKVGAPFGVGFVPERLQTVHQLAGKRRRRFGAAEDPAPKVLIGLIQEGLEPVELGRREAGDMLVRERPQNEVRFPEAAAPGAQLQLLQPSIV